MRIIRLVHFDPLKNTKLHILTHLCINQHFAIQFALRAKIYFVLHLSMLKKHFSVFFPTFLHIPVIKTPNIIHQLTDTPTLPH